MDKRDASCLTAQIKVINILPSSKDKSDKIKQKLYKLLPQKGGY